MKHRGNRGSRRRNRIAPMVYLKYFCFLAVVIGVFCFSFAAYAQIAPKKPDRSLMFAKEKERIQAQLEKLEEERDRVYRLDTPIHQYEGWENKSDEEKENIIRIFEEGKDKELEKLDAEIEKLQSRYDTLDENLQKENERKEKYVSSLSEGSDSGSGSGSRSRGSGSGSGSSAGKPGSAPAQEEEEIDSNTYIFVGVGILVLAGIGYAVVLFKRSAKPAADPSVTSKSKGFSLAAAAKAAEERRKTFGAGTDKKK